MIVTFTNKYIDSVCGNFSRERDAMPTDMIEMKSFIGLLYIAGMHKSRKKNLDDLWDSSRFGIEIFRLTMSIRRFLFLLCPFRFDDQKTLQQRRKIDRLAPIRDLLGEFVKTASPVTQMDLTSLLMRNWRPFEVDVLLYSIFRRYQPSKV